MMEEDVIMLAFTDYRRDTTSTQQKLYLFTQLNKKKAYLVNSPLTSKNIACRSIYKGIMSKLNDTGNDIFFLAHVHHTI